MVSFLTKNIRWLGVIYTENIRWVWLRFSEMRSLVSGLHGTHSAPKQNIVLIRLLGMQAFLRSKKRWLRTWLKFLRWGLSGNWCEHEAWSGHRKRGCLADAGQPLKTSGETGIRTPGTSPYACFQDRCIRPLCHLSIMSCLSFLIDDAKLGDVCEICKRRGDFSLNFLNSWGQKRRDLFSNRVR